MHPRRACTSSSHATSSRDRAAEPETQSTSARAESTAPQPHLGATWVAHKISDLPDSLRPAGSVYSYATPTNHDNGSLLPNHQAPIQVVLSDQNVTDFW